MAEPLTAKSRRVRAGRVEKMPPGSKTFVPDDYEDVLVVNVDGEYFAVSNTCPHAGAWLGYGPLDGFILECPMHYWPFDVRNGCLAGMEGSGLYERLNTYPVVVEAGEVFVEMPAGV